MSEKPPRKFPGPDHPITVTPNPNRVVVTAAGKVIAATRDALTLREADYPPITYIPRTDTDMTALSRTDHVSQCPYKGEASYYSIPAGGVRSTNAVWSYEDPYPNFTMIRDYLAFFPDRIDAIEELPS